MIKRVVHIERINTPGEKRQFQIKLPFNTKRLLQLYTTTNAMDRLFEGEETMLFSSEIGWLWLRTANFQDVFYTEIIKLPLQNYNQTFYGHLPVDDFADGAFWTQGRKKEFFDITLNLETWLLEGFYVDRLLLSKSSAETTSSSNSLRAIIGYELQIYLTIEV